MDQSTLDQLNSLLGKNSSSGGGLIDMNALIQPLMPYIIALTVVSILITILYVISIIDKWRSNRAIIEIRNILREMNARDKPTPVITSPVAQEGTISPVTHS